MRLAATRSTILLLVALLASSVAHAASAGRLEVRVLGDDGAPARGVAVRATEKRTNRELELETGKRGQVRFMALAGGEVIVRAELAGFQVVEKNVLILVGQTARVEVALAPLHRLLTEEEMSPDQLAAKHAAEAYNSAVARYQAGDHAAARSGVAEALRSEPDLAPAFLLDARLKSEAEDHDGAADSYIRALELDAALDRYLPDLIGELQLSGRKEEAAIYSARLEGLPAETPEELYDLVLVKVNVGDDAVAAGLIDEILERDPNHAASYYQRGLIRLRLGASVGAVEDMQRYLELAPDGPHNKEARGFVAALAD